MQFNGTTYQSLLVLAENYRIARPPRIRMCLHCLLAVTNLNPPDQVRLRTHLQIGSLLIRFTENKQLAQTHLHAAIALSQSTRNSLAYFEAVSLLSTLLCQMSQAEQAKPILREAITASQNHVYWHARLLLQLASIYHEEGDHTSTLQLLELGADLAVRCGSDYLKILFILSKGMVLLVQQKLEDVNLVLPLCGELIDGLKEATPMQVESHKVYFLTLQVAHLLQGGQVKGVKSSLKQLQQSIQELSTMPASACSLIPPEASGQLNEISEVDEMTNKLMSTDGFTWLPRDHMCVLVYFVTATHSLLGGYLDKAQKYTEKALKLIRKLKVSDTSALLVQMELMFLEHLAQSHLIMCDRKAALRNINDGCRLCVTYPQNPVIVRHTTQMHTLLGMYCMSMNFMGEAEKHFQIATKGSLYDEQLMTNLLNLAMVHIHNYQLSNGRISAAKQQELAAILNRINPESPTLQSRNLKAASFFVKGMFEFFRSIHNEAKRFLRETLTISDAQDLKRLTACALVLLAHIYLTVGNSEESVNMAVPAMQIANKIPDTSVRLWSSALLRDLYRLSGNEESFNEYKKMYEKIASRLLGEQYTASESSQHELIKWFSEDLPPVKILEAPEPAEGVSKAGPESTATACLINPVWSESTVPFVPSSAGTSEIAAPPNLRQAQINSAAPPTDSPVFYDSNHSRSEAARNYAPQAARVQQQAPPVDRRPQMMASGPKNVPQNQNYATPRSNLGLHGLMPQNRAALSDSADSTRHRPNLFMPYQLPRQSDEQPRHKPTSHDITSLMSGAPQQQKQELPPEFQSALQQQQFQAFQQMQQMGQMQHMYADGSGYGRSPAPQTDRAQMQQQHAATWGVDPNAIFNISNAGYPWR